MKSAFRFNNILSFMWPLVILSVLWLGTFIAAQLYFNANRANAADARQFRAERIIDDNIFTDGNSMSVSQIQSFLIEKNSVCLKDFRSLSLRDKNGDGIVQDSTTEKYGGDSGSETMSAAELISAAAKIYRISPKALIVTLQKEQGLINRTDCPAWRYNTALGYGCPDTAPCDQSAFGFTRQIDYGAYHLRGYIDDSLNSVPYTTGNQRIYWHPDTGRCGSSTVNIQNRSTVALYSYTPYRPNQASLDAQYGLGDSCSSYGNRNFWQYFNDWFGTTVGPQIYEWQPVSQEVYANAARTTELSSYSTLQAGQTVYLRIKAKNTGNQVWDQSFLNLGTSYPFDRKSLFKNASWLTAERPAKMLEQVVQPGQIATFEFTMTAPSQIGTYREYFNPVAENRSWLNDIGLYFEFTVVSNTPYDIVFTEIQYYFDRAYTRPIKLTYLPLHTGDTVYARAKFKNIGNQPLDKNSTLLGTTGPRDRISPFANQSWISNNRLAQMNEATLQPNQVGTFDYSITVPANPGTFTESYSVVAEGKGWADATSRITTNIVSKAELPSETSNVILSRGDLLISQNNLYTLVHQNDGNLVLYSEGRGAIWSSKTVGRNSLELAVQNDGNLVLYTTGFKPVWATNTTSSPGSKLVLQNDGNLVMYNSQYKAVWSTNTVER